MFFLWYFAEPLLLLFGQGEDISRMLSLLFWPLDPT